MRNVEDIYPLTPMQKAMLFHDISAPHSRVNFVQSSYRLRGNIHVQMLKQAWASIIERHAPLRTFFLWKDLDEPLQVVLKEMSLPWIEHDWQDTSLQQEQLFDSLQVEDRQHGFDLARAPLVRLHLIILNENTYYLLWSMHHIVLDGWSAALLLNEVLTLYEASCRGSNLSLAPVRPYSDYIAWLQQQDLTQAEQYWRKALLGKTTPTVLRRMHILAEPSYEEYHLPLSSATTAALRALARQCQVTVNVLMQGIMALLLSHYSAEQDVLFGATVAGRPTDLIGVESMCGLFITMLPVRIVIVAETPVSVWLTQLQVQHTERHRYEYCPPAQIQGWSEIPWTSPLFHCLLVFENYPTSNSQAATTEYAFEMQNMLATARSNYPFTLVVDAEDSFDLYMIFDRQYFTDDIASHVKYDLATLIDNLTTITDSNVPLSSLFLSTYNEQHPKTTWIADKDTSVRPIQTTQVKVEKTALVPPRDTLELQLVQLWEEILHIHPIGVTDNFFALGGQSLLALYLFTQLQQRFEQKLSSSLLLQMGTIEQLARLLRRQNSVETDSVLVPIQPHGTRSPFFCVHPAMGGVLAYYHLAHHLSSDQPFYGLQDPHHEREIAPFVAIETMAAHYIATLRTQQPTGPYFLGGWSLGGVVAFEMAQQLQCQGNNVALLVLIDSGAPELASKFVDDATFLATMAIELLRGTTRITLQDLYLRLRDLSLEQQFVTVQELLESAHMALPEQGTSWLRRDWHLFKTRVEAVRQYQAHPHQAYRRPIVLFRSSEWDSLAHSASGLERLPDLGWQRHATLPIEIQVIPGYHDTIIFEPHVQVLAQHLQNYLDKASIVNHP